MSERCEAMTEARVGLRKCGAPATIAVQRVYSRIGQPPPTTSSYWHTATHYFCDRHKRESEFVPANASIVSTRRV